MPHAAIFISGDLCEEKILLYHLAGSGHFVIDNAR
jgi:hypothetical protein